MDKNEARIGSSSVLEVSALSSLIAALHRGGYQVVGPRLRDGAIVCEVIDKAEDLPAGWGDEQEAGQYRVKKREDEAIFGHNLGPQSWKKFFHPAEFRMMEAQRDNGKFAVLRPAPAPPKLALLGVRPCELAAIRVQDRVFLGDRYVEPGYQARREGAFVIAVNCTQAARTCFCASMGTGPRANTGFDLALTELLTGERHAFVAEVGSEAGAELLGRVQHQEARKEDLEAAEAAVKDVAGAMSRAIDTNGLRELLYDAFDDPRWERIAARCLSCGNCTMVCPTCFCTTTEDVSDVTGTRAERWRKWDSCFTESFSYIHGGSLRLSPRSRYRQWLTHKLAAWQDQFGMLGCVGCGRCITWCPGKIDLTEEVRALRGDAAGARK